MGDGRILEVAGLQIVTPRPVFGSSSLTRSRWFMARSKASRTDFRTEDDRASISFILSSILLTPKGAILDLGSHCLMREKTILENVFTCDNSFQDLLYNTQNAVQHLFHSLISLNWFCFTYIVII